jgi:hypothetical protein
MIYTLATAWGVFDNSGLYAIANNEMKNISEYTELILKFIECGART